MKDRIVKFRELSEEQVHFICNGCGGKGSVINPPEFMFNASCDQHDYNYCIGGNGGDRVKADYQFYQAMKKDVREYAWYRRPFYYAMAWLYYIAVRLMGHKFFNYGKKNTLIDIVNKVMDDAPPIFSGLYDFSSRTAFDKLEFYKLLGYETMGRLMIDEKTHKLLNKKVKALREMDNEN